MKIVEMWIVTDKEHKTFMYLTVDDKYFIMRKNRITGEDTGLLEITDSIANNYLNP